MVAQLLGLAFLYLTTGPVTFTAHALQINHTGEVVYRDSNVFGVVDNAVILECGATLPDLYIWSFTRPGSQTIKALVYNLGRGPRMQKLAEVIGQPRVTPNSAAVSIEKVPLAAQGLFTCQAFYDIDEEPVVFFYYVHLTVGVPISQPNLLVSDASPVEGSSVWMRCSVDNGTEPIQYVWKLKAHDGSITNFTEGNSSMINLTEVNRNHTGWYRCVASNAVNTEISDWLWLDTKFGPDVPQVDVTPYSITERGYSALETENVSLSCQAQSNPASQYVWFYNDSQVYTGPQFTITEVLRVHAGDYTCLAQNSYLNTSSRRTISLTVYYPPDGSPSCSLEPALNHTSLKLLCSWPGGFPSPSLHWTGDRIHSGQEQTHTEQKLSRLSSKNILLPSGGLNSTSSLFTCQGSHPALKQLSECSTHTYVPPAEPQCFSNVTTDKQFLILSCSWDGGVPAALVRWEGPGVKSKGGEENSSILVLHYGSARSEKPYTCYATHPLLVQTKTCKLTLAPVSKPHLLLSDAPVEGSSIWMRCIVENGTKPIQYVWQHETSRSNFTVFSQNSNNFINVTDVTRNHTGWYRCVASNAVNTERSDWLWMDTMFGPDVPQVDATPERITVRGYSALERENVSLSCQAQSNPASQYVWFYNDSQVHTGPQFTITEIPRTNTGDYTCLAQNTYLNTRSRRTISLTVYYPPDGSPSCSVEPVLNHTSLRLLCSWLGGFPSPSLHWTGDLIPAQEQVNTSQQTNQLSTDVSVPSGGLTANSSLFTCVGSHPALRQLTDCSTHAYIPPAEMVCFSNVTNDRKHLILSCSWDGGVPAALVWWEGPDGQSKDVNVLVLSYSTFHFGKPYTCYAKHPLQFQTKTCSLTLVPVSEPQLQISDASPVEGSTLQMRCSVENGTEPIRYVWQRETNNHHIATVSEGNSSLFTITNVNRNQAGWYRCVASNSINSETSEQLWLDTIFGPDVPQVDVTPYRIINQGHSALERETVALSCQAQSNPASQYVWFYNNSQVYTGPQFTITEVLRVHAGDYTCLAQNSYLNTRSRRTISLTVYYPPDGSPSCSVEPALNHTSLRLLCSWPGGFPSPSLHWTGDLKQAEPPPADSVEQRNLQTVLLPSEGLTPNSSSFTCQGSHPALNQLTECSTRTYVPASEPVCFAYVTNNKQYLILSCSWSGGAPKALVWWEGPGGQSKGGEENSNILVLRYGTARSGKPYTCYAKHPLLVQPKTCGLTLEAPVLLTQRRVVSVYEGTDVQLTCNLRANYLPTNEISWFNNHGVDVQDTSKYMLLRTSAWANLTVRDTDETLDSGQYRCSTSNAVGGAEINVTLVVKKHPMPPNATLISVIYNSRRRNEVELEWQVEGEEDGGWTGFVLEHRWVSERPGRRRSANDSEEQMEERTGSKDWYSSIIQDPDVRTHTVRGLTPTVTYQFRITPVNHRTVGHPSAAKTPVELRNHAYPAVIGAAIGGMLFAAIFTAVLLMYIIRNRNNNPRLHDMLFGLQHSQSRENINFPEDEVVDGSEGGREDADGPPSEGPTMAVVQAPSPPHL